MTILFKLLAMPIQFMECYAFQILVSEFRTFTNLYLTDLHSKIVKSPCHDVLPVAPAKFQSCCSIDFMSAIRHQAQMVDQSKKISGYLKS